MQRPFEKHRICNAGAGLQSMFPMLNHSLYMPVRYKLIGLHVIYASHVMCMQIVVCVSLHQGSRKVNSLPTRPIALDQMLSAYESARKAQRMATLLQLCSAGLGPMTHT